jgi:tRNA U34 5-methylaminomethyl-2-thiouridine-forming methyltransferase MnmC
MHEATDYHLVRLANGAFSVRSLVHHETFHPVIGPVAEAETLYAAQLRLSERASSGHGEFVIWDVGLGAAANALAALRAMRSIPRPLRLISFDHTLAPLQFALQHQEKLAYFQEYQTAAHELLAHQRSRWDNGAALAQWELRLADFPSLLSETPPPSHTDTQSTDLPSPDAILYDPFSPAKNPAMWTLPLFARLYRWLDPERPCLLATYSRSTFLRVTLLLAGFFVGVGHATGEKEETTLAANDPQWIRELLPRRWLARARRSTSGEPLHEPVYRQAPLSLDTWDRLSAHPQFI